MILAGAPGTTVTATCPVKPPDVAEMVALPLRAPVTRPELTVATVGSELDHVTFDAGELPPEPLLMLAVACTEVPDAIEVVGSVITRDELGPVGEPPPPPHPAKASDNIARIAETRRIRRISPLCGRAERPSRSKRVVHMLSLLPTRGELNQCHPSLFVWWQRYDCL
jgi:hypothetical protein